MGLNNTQTPVYYGQFRDKVIRGEIPVCKTVSMQMNLIDDLIANPGVYYDEDAVEGFIAFCENELTLTDGSDLHLLDTFKLWAEDVFGWYYFIERTVPVPDGRGHMRYEKKQVKKRLRNKQYLIIPRGAAKSMYDSCIQNYFLNVEGTTTHQIATAPTMRQADEVLSPMRTAITRARGPLFQLYTQGSLLNNSGNRAMRQILASTKKGIENFLTGSWVEIRPMSIDKLQGLRPFVSTVDEWLSGDTSEDVVGALEQGASKMEDWLIIATSSEGTVRNGPGDSIKMELMQMLKGEYFNPHVSIWWYQLDDIKEVGDPTKWVKAQPNLGLTVSYETYQLEVERAEKAPEARNDILAKRFSIPMEGYTYFFTYQETICNTRPSVSYRGLPCAMGADLSMGDDFCAFDFLFPLGRDEFGVYAVSYITERTLNNLPPAMRNKYEEFIAEGSLRVMNGTILDMLEVYDDIDSIIQENQFDVRCFGYDPYNATQFVERWVMENGAYGVEKVPQGFKTESVPLGDLKTLAEDNKLKIHQQIMTFCMGNCIALTNTNGGKKLYKQAHDKKIDNVAALMDAYVAYKANKEFFE